MLVKFHPPVELMYLKPNLSMFPDAQKENYGNMAGEFCVENYYREAKDGRGK